MDIVPIAERMEALGVDLSEVTRIDGGFLVRETDEYVIEVHKMLTNWRLIVAPPNQRAVIDHGYCYFGTGPEPLTRAILAGLKWDDPYAQHPIGFDKHAF